MAAQIRLHRSLAGIVPGPDIGQPGIKEFTVDVFGLAEHEISPERVFEFHGIVQGRFHAPGRGLAHRRHEPRVERAQVGLLRGFPENAPLVKAEAVADG